MLNILKPSALKITFFSMVKFGNIGAVSTVFGIFCYYILLELLQLPIYPVYVGVWFVTIFLSYLMNITFNYKRPFAVYELVRFYGGYFIGLLFGLGVIATLRYFDLGLTDFQLTLTPIVPRFLLTFLVVHKFAYRKKVFG